MISMVSRVARAALFVFAVVGFSNPAWSQSVHDEAQHMLIVGMLSEPETLHPLVTNAAETRDITERMFLKLLEERGDFLRFRPRLAREWKFSKDGLALTFHLRDDVRWHDGAPVTAEDVRFTWQLQTDTLVAWHSVQIKEQIRDVEVIDPHTVVFHFNERYPYQLMDANDGVILPRHILESVPRDELATDAFSRAPTGNGPYRFVRWVPGQFLELAANNDYYEGPPVVRKVIYRFVPDMVTLVTQLKKGEIDVLESVPPDQAKQFVDNVSVQLFTYPSRRMNYIAWNLDNELFENREIREALTMAINRREIIQTVWGGYASECKSPIHPILWAYNNGIRVIMFDVGQAKGKLRMRGWRDSDGDGIRDKDGKKFEFDLLVNNNQVRVDVVTLVQAYLARVGVKVNVRVLEFNTYIERVLDKNFDAAFIGWRTSTKVDLTNLWHSSAIPPNGYNVTSYSNSHVDGLIDKAKVQLDSPRAMDLWYKVQSQIYLDQPVTFLAVPLEVNALHRRFCNVHPNAISFFANLRAWRIAPDCSP